LTLYRVHERISIEHPTGDTTALDHWSLEYYDIRLESIDTSAGYKMRNRRHSALDLCGYIGAQPLCFLCFFAKPQRRPVRQDNTSWRFLPRNPRRNAERKGQEPGHQGHRPPRKAKGKRNPQPATLTAPFKKEPNDTKRLAKYTFLQYNVSAIQRHVKIKECSA